MAGIVQGDPNIAAYNAAIVRRALDEFEIVGYTHPIDADRIERKDVLCHHKGNHGFLEER